MKSKVIKRPQNILKMDRVRYKFDVFYKYKSFDVVPYQEVIDDYLKVENKLRDLGLHHSGNTSGPKFSDKHPETFTKEYSKSHKPFIFFIKDGAVPFDSTGCKADITVMDMNKLGVNWDHWVFFTIPREFILTYQERVLDNQSKKLVGIFRQFMDTCIANNYTKEEIIKLGKEYDNLYPDPYPYPTHRPMRPGWRFDLEISMFSSVIETGIVYPITYNSQHEILHRGTHRALIFATVGYDVPIFFKHPHLGGSLEIAPFRVRTRPSFSSNIYEFEFDLKNKIYTIYNSNNKILMTNG